MMSELQRKIYYLERKIAADKTQLAEESANFALLVHNFKSKLGTIQGLLGGFSFGFLLAATLGRKHKVKNLFQFLLFLSEMRWITYLTNAFKKAKPA